MTAQLGLFFGDIAGIGNFAVNYFLAYAAARAVGASQEGAEHGNPFEKEAEDKDLVRQLQKEGKHPC